MDTLHDAEASERDGYFYFRLGARSIISRARHLSEKKKRIKLNGRVVKRAYRYILR